MDQSFAHIRDSLKRYTATKQPPPERLKARASVAIVLAGEDDDLYMSLIQRAERDTDRWSGHMSFPGGRASEEDSGVVATAMRETREEVGLILGEEHFVGELDELNLLAHGSARHGVLSSCVFTMEGDLPKLTPETGEVAEAYWIAVRELYDPDVLTTLEWSHPDTGESMAFPGLRYREQIIWGLTYRVLSQLSELLRWPLPGT